MPTRYRQWIGFWRQMTTLPSYLPPAPEGFEWVSCKGLSGNEKWYLRKVSAPVVVKGRLSAPVSMNEEINLYNQVRRFYE